MNVKKILYVGIYGANTPRDKVYFEALRGRGISVAQITDSSFSFIKYAKLAVRLLRVSREYDLVWAGYLSPFVAVIAKICSRKPVVYNAGNSLYEAYVLDRQTSSRYSPVSWWIWFVDYLAFKFADMVLLESESQKEFISKIFHPKASKLKVVLTPADGEVFHPDASVRKLPTFTVLFRGMLLPGTGVEYVLEAARLLKGEDIDFRLNAWGQLLPHVKTFIGKYKLNRVRLNTVFLEPSDLRKAMLECHVMLGQFSSNERLERTIQHKNSEAMALGMPFITRDSRSNRELLADGKDCLFVPSADARALADKILFLKAHPEVREKLSKGARETYLQRLSPEALVKPLIEALGSV